MNSSSNLSRTQKHLCRQIIYKADKTIYNQLTADEKADNTERDARLEKADIFGISCQNYVL